MRRLWSGEAVAVAGGGESAGVVTELAGGVGDLMNENVVPVLVMGAAIVMALAMGWAKMTRWTSP